MCTHPTSRAIAQTSIQRRFYCTPSLLFESSRAFLPPRKIERSAEENEAFFPGEATRTVHKSLLNLARIMEKDNNNYRGVLLFKEKIFIGKKEVMGKLSDRLVNSDDLTK